MLRDERRFRPRVDPLLLADVLRLTDPSDTIMDLKGETVFRDRPFYYVLEIVTLARMQLGVIPDTIPEALVAHRTCVAAADDVLSKQPLTVDDVLAADGWARTTATSLIQKS